MTVELHGQAFNATWKANRIGRLLPPFLTRLLERYVAYSHRPGVPRVPSALVPAPITEARAPDYELPDEAAAPPTIPTDVAPTEVL